ncbi:hypothetical protein D3C87_1534890 [compost metagenome]
MQIQRLFFDTGEEDRFQGCLFGAARELQAVFIGGRFVAPEETDHHRFATGAGAGQHFFSHFRRRWFRD